MSEPDLNGSAELLSLDGEDEEAFRGFYRGRTRYRVWRQHILACVYHRRFRLAARILQHVLQNLGVSQDIWLWRVIVIVLANLEATDDLFHKLYRVLYFGKTADYDERRLTLFFLMMKVGKIDMALEYLEKDMPKRMRSSVKQSKITEIKQYEDRYHAALQMWRGVASFWKTNETTSDSPLYCFNHDRFKKTQGSGAETAPAPAVEEETDDFMSASGYEIRHVFPASRVLDMFEEFLDTFESMDPFLRYYLEIAKIGGFYDRIEKTLRRYVLKNPDSPTALQILIDHYTTAKPDETALCRAPLKRLCKLVPYGRHVTLLAEDLLQDEDGTDLETICQLIIPALGHRYHWADVTCWTWMAVIILRIPHMESTQDDQVQFLLEACEEIRSYWKTLHFRSPEADQEDSKLVLAKIRVCWAFYGPDCSYVADGRDLLRSKYGKKLEKSRSGLDEAYKVLAGDAEADGSPASGRGSSMEV